MSYRKVRFWKGEEATAGIVIPNETLKRLNVSEISRFFPVFEARKMEYMQSSPTFDTFEEAFDYEFTGGPQMVREKRFQRVKA